MRALSETARTKQAKLVANWNATHPGLKVTYIDGVVSAFNGHEPDPATNSRNDYRWINEFFETRGRLAANGKTTSTLSLDAAEFYHPNIIGHQQMANLIINRVGVPANVKPANSPAIAPAVYAMSSAVQADGEDAPEAWIQGPYVAQEGSTLSLDARGSYAGDGTITAYEWDLDGDGIFEQTYTEPVIDYTFEDLYDGQIGLRVIQDDGQTDVYTTQVQITDDGDNTPPELDNCPAVNNYSQSDYDGDGVGDACDPDPGYPTEDQPGVCVVGDNCPDDDADAAPAPTPDGAGAAPGASDPSGSATGAATADTTNPEPAAPAPDAAGDAAAVGNQPAIAADSPTALGTAVATETPSSPYAIPASSTAHDTRTRLANTGTSLVLTLLVAAAAATAGGTLLLAATNRRQSRQDR